jgi:hypothetical protein
MLANNADHLFNTLVWIQTFRVNFWLMWFHPHS